MDIYLLLAAKIRALRIRHRLTPAECAERAGMSRASYQRLEAGQTKRIKLMTVVRLAGVFGLKTADFLESIMP